jgi:hypothetical protein
MWELVLTVVFGVVLVELVFKLFAIAKKRPRFSVWDLLVIVTLIALTLGTWLLLQKVVDPPPTLF